MGELSPIQVWPEVWVEDERYAEAKELVETLMAKQDLAPWQCPKCAEENAANFEVCWQCQTENLNASQ